VLQKYWTPVFTGVTTFDEVIRIEPASKPKIMLSFIPFVPVVKLF
jgi:hypothetical protein